MMQGFFVILYKSFRRTKYSLLAPFQYCLTGLLFYCNNVKRGTFSTRGIPFVSVARGSRFVIGNNFTMNNIIAANPIGRVQKCSFFVDRNASLEIGNNVAMSFTAISCSLKIIIKDNVMIGGGTCIYDTDFHPLSHEDRLADKNENIVNSPVVIESNVFIGANSTILKGVTIGNNSIIGACSVVTKNIPPNEIWAGNPAKFIKAHSPEVKKHTGQLK